MKVNIHEAKTNLSKLIVRFQQGEEIVVAKNGKPIFKFAPVGDDLEQTRPVGFFNCEVDMSHFDEPLEEMKDYQ